MKARTVAAHVSTVATKILPTLGGPQTLGSCRAFDTSGPEHQRFAAFRREPTRKGERHDGRE